MVFIYQSERQINAMLRIRFVFRDFIVSDPVACVNNLFDPVVRVRKQISGFRRRKVTLQCKKIGKLVVLVPVDAG